LLFEKENTTLSGMCQKFQRNLEKMSILSILAIFVNYKTGKRHHRDSLLFKKENAILKSAHTHLSKKNDFLASRIVSFQIVFKEKKTRTVLQLFQFKYLSEHS